MESKYDTDNDGTDAAKTLENNMWTKSIQDLQAIAVKLEGDISSSLSDFGSISDDHKRGITRRMDGLRKRYNYLTKDSGSILDDNVIHFTKKSDKYLERSSSPLEQNLESDSEDDTFEFLRGIDALRTACSSLKKDLKSVSDDDESEVQEQNDDSTLRNSQISSLPTDYSDDEKRETSRRIDFTELLVDVLKIVVSLKENLLKCVMLYSTDTLEQAVSAIKILKRNNSVLMKDNYNLSSKNDAMAAKLSSRDKEVAELVKNLNVRFSQMCEEKDTLKSSIRELTKRNFELAKLNMELAKLNLKLSSIGGRKSESLKEIENGIGHLEKLLSMADKTHRFREAEVNKLMKKGTGLFPKRKNTDKRANSDLNVTSGKTMTSARGNFFSSNIFSDENTIDFGNTETDNDRSVTENSSSSAGDESKKISANLKDIEHVGKQLDALLAKQKQLLRTLEKHCSKLR